MLETRICSPARSLRSLVILAALPLLGGCAVAGHTSSPWEWGGGVRVAPALWELGDAGVTAHPMASYTYLSFDGGNDQLWEFGAQLRKPLGNEAQSPWIGGEAAFSRLNTSIDGAGDASDSSTNGYSFTAMIGKPFGSSRWQPSIYAGAGISDYGAQGWNIRLGVDLQPEFLWGN